MLQDRRVLAAVGAGAALLAGILIALFFSGKGGGPTEIAAANRGGLTVEMSGEQPRLDPSRPLRCFVDGQFIGLATLADCAKRNGVAAQSLDVGLDNSGELAAGDAAQLKPLAQVTPPTQVAVNDTPKLPPLEAAQAPSGAGGAECLRYGADGWRAVGGAMSQNACAQVLFDGRCPKAGDAIYGRWGGQTLRLVPGKIEISADNRTFSTLSDPPANCPG